MDSDGLSTKHRKIIEIPLFLLFCFLLILPLNVEAIGRKFYTNQWAVKIDNYENEVNELAQKYGFVNRGKILDSYYLFEKRAIRKRSLRRSRTIHNEFAKDKNVVWLEQQFGKVRTRRDPVVFGTKRKPRQGDSLLKVDQQLMYHTNSTNTSDLITDQIEISKLNDPYWPHMWYLNRKNGMDHNVVEAWQLGYSGKNIVVSILDDGLERTHPDIQANYDPLASTDINDDDDDPTPRYTVSNENRHGTRCAGEVAAVYNNSLCIVGVAFNAKVGGIRMLDGDVTDAVEAKSLSHNRDHIDIYTSTWGPDDDGRTVDGPQKLAKLAFEDGIKKGRGGKGSIFIWASGNGGRYQDNCGCDGYTNSIYTISISSATEHDKVPWYSEACSSTLATIYSSGGPREKMIVTTDLNHSCTRSHTGTSASAPLAAGICALTLEANHQLTWRDMQHIIIRTSQSQSLISDDWVINGAGFKVSHNFGFGLMDAGAMVKLAANWTNVPDQQRCVNHFRKINKTTSSLARSRLEFDIDDCSNDDNKKVVVLEHVELKITLTGPRRGMIGLSLISASGTKSILVSKRPRDSSRSGFRDWTFMTTHNWGESPTGKWMLHIVNHGTGEVYMKGFDLILYGTAAPIGAHGGVDKDYGQNEQSSWWSTIFEFLRQIM